MDMIHVKTAIHNRMNRIEITDLTLPELQVYTSLNEAQLLHYYEPAPGIFIAESPKVIERALDAAQEGDPLADGVRMTLKMMLDALAKFGFEEVPAKGEEFDPEKHNAVMRETGDEPGKVLEVFQKGYKVKDKIIRYAMVKVAAE